MPNNIFSRPRPRLKPTPPYMPEELTVCIRKANASDIKPILRIENQRFPHPWKENYFSSELDHDISYFYVAEDSDARRIAGYIIFWIIADLLELHKIASAEEYKKKGVGKKLFLFMLKTAEQKKVGKIFLEVRKSNTDVVKWYESFAFQCVGIRKGYYSNPAEDALVYCLDTSSKR
jgi:ribosomal-protein-alanine N-acetyltransferase